LKIGRVREKLGCDFDFAELEDDVGEKLIRTILKFSSIVRGKRSLLGAALTLSLIAMGSGQLVNFEDISTTSLGEGGQTSIGDQYSHWGIYFNNPVALNYSEDIPGFAHSGSTAIEQCYAKERCHTPIEMTFPEPVSQLNLWAGYRRSLETSRTVVLEAFDAQGNMIEEDRKEIGPSSGPLAIATPLQVSTTENEIAKAQVSFDSSQGFENSGLAVDDVEFSRILNQPPVLRSLDSDMPSPASAGRNITFMAHAFDTDGDPIQFAFLLDGAAKTSWTYQPSWSWHTSNEDAGMHSIQVLARDGHHAQDPRFTAAALAEGQASDDSLEIPFEIKANLLPVIESLGYEGEPESEESITFHTNASDPEDDPILYMYQVDGGARTSWTSQPNWTWNITPQEIGLHMVQVRAKDESNADGYSSFEKGINVTLNQPPRVKALICRPDESQTAGSTVEFRVRADDPEGDRLHYQYHLDGAVARDWSEEPSWVWGTSAQDKGRHVITVRVRDGKHAKEYDDALSLPYFLEPPGLDVRPPLIIGALVLASGALLVVRMRRIPRPPDGSPRFKPDVGLRAEADPGNMKTDIDRPVSIILETSFLLAADAGSQDIEDSRPSIADERNEK
jgi:hypothetical protein